MFVELYPRCTVIYSYPNSVRPPLPYVVLDFERIEPVNSFEYVKSGILWQEKCKRIPFSAELVTESKTEHAAGVKKVGLSTAVDDLEQATQFFDSQYAGDKMRAMNITVCTEGSPEPIHNRGRAVLFMWILCSVLRSTLPWLRLTASIRKTMLVQHPKKLQTWKPDGLTKSKSKKKSEMSKGAKPHEYRQNR
jgi:hypothetical protein